MNSKQNTAKKINEAPQNKLEVIKTWEDEPSTEHVPKQTPAIAAKPQTSVSQNTPSPTRTKPLTFSELNGERHLKFNVASVKQTFGTSDESLVRRFIVQTALGSPPTQYGPTEDCNNSLAALHDIAPRDTLEGMLIMQMKSVHDHAMHWLARTSKDGEHADDNVNRAIKFLATFTRQMDALNKYRNKDTDSIAIGQVHVHEGAQAIVGRVGPSDSTAPTGKERNEKPE